ncbi:unnamed protein product [Didymodactylos carnosus]|uniref:Dynein light chain n=1 Tax=Didymodactylos carnosus TaxID=1234261 RepID=A0A814CG07_9BILA|nr:unnamed protein product [Didymodactylos carnosus]CAF3716277.1 unnamed protein product [Didymodactylos carnosus]
MSVNTMIVKKRDSDELGPCYRHKHHIECFELTNAADIIRKSIEDILHSNDYDDEKTENWSMEIVKMCQEQLYQSQKDFKMIVTCIIVPKKGKNVHMSNACLWQFPIDGSCIIRWENLSMYCVVSAFALTL